MGSMIEGSEGWAREDELDLGPDDGDPRRPDHGALDHTKLAAEELVDDELDAVEDAQDQASEKTAEPVDAHERAPSTPRRTDVTATQGSLDESASTPDDTPSVHVSGATDA